MTNDPLKVAIEALQTCAIKPDMPYFPEHRYRFDEKQVKEALSALTAHQELPKGESSDAERLDWLDLYAPWRSWTGVGAPDIRAAIDQAIASATKENKND